KAGHRPRGRKQTGNVRHLHHEPARLHGVNIVDDHASIFAEIFFVAHTGTVGVIETRPFRVSSKLCLNSPRFIVLVTLLTKYNPSKAGPAPRTPTSCRAFSSRPYRSTSSEPLPVTASPEDDATASPRLMASIGETFAVSRSTSTRVGSNAVAPSG